MNDRSTDTTKKDHSEQNINSPFVTTTPAASPPVFLDHFASLEQPEALVHAIRAFFKPLRY